jgi:predicted PurR-regulated permease PerM
LHIIIIIVVVAMLLVAVVATGFSTVIAQFTSLIRSSKTAPKVKTRRTKINFPLLPNGNNDRFARGRSLYEQKLARKLKNRY